MFVNRKQGLRAIATLQATLFAVAIPLVGCGPMIFADATALQIAGTPPAPPPPPAVEQPKDETVVVTKDSIIINDKIQFDYNKATIKEVSFGLLDKIVKVINENTHIAELSIEGHTDSDGSDRYNEKLSDKRAASVRQYFIDHGVVEGRLVSKGWGEAKPVDSNDSDAGKAANRRVEFIITKQETVIETVRVDAKTGTRTVVDSKVAPKATAREVVPAKSASEGAKQ